MHDPLDGLQTRPNGQITLLQGLLHLHLWVFQVEPDGQWLNGLQ